MGSFDEEYLSIPDEVIRATIRNNQKCQVRDPKTGKLTNKFILTANIGHRRRQDHRRRQRARNPRAG